MCAFYLADAGGKLAPIVTFLPCGRSGSDPTPGFRDNRHVSCGVPGAGTFQTAITFASARDILIAKNNFLILKAGHAHNHSVRTLPNRRCRRFPREVGPNDSVGRGRPASRGKGVSDPVVRELDSISSCHVPPCHGACRKPLPQCLSADRNRYRKPCQLNRQALHRKALPLPPLGAADSVIRCPRARCASHWALFRHRSAAGIR